MSGRIVAHLDAYYKPRPGMYPWPCAAHPERKIQLFADDVLTKSSGGGYTKHTGLCCVSIMVPDDCVELVEKSGYIELL